jgi:nitrogen fixation/metabolism regulation signal transduction histidine kinase
MPELNDLIEVYNHMAAELHEERVRAEEQENFLQKMLSISPLGVLVLDFEARIASMNATAEKLLGLEFAAVRGQKLADLRTAQEGFVAGLGGLRVGEANILLLSGRRRVRCTRSELFDRGHARQFILIEELTEELHRTEKAAYDRLIRLMSHEINNTTGAVTSLLQSCLDYGRQLTEPDRQEFVEALDVAIRRSTHMNQFMKRFADVIRLPPPQKRPLDVHVLLQDITQLMLQEAAKRRIRIEWDRREPLPLVPMDAAQMEQVLVNIFRNALEAIVEDGRILLRTQQMNGRSEVHILDSGAGLSPEASDNLFTPFYTTKLGGQGIGLTLVREILEAHRFEYSLERTPEALTRFRILM